MSKINRILVPTDFSEPAEHALQYASDLAKRAGASLTVLYADSFLPPIDYSYEFGTWAKTNVPILEEDAKKKIDDEISRFVDSTVSAESVVRVATAADGIVEQAMQTPVNLIVMGTHGRSGMPRIVFGSVTEEVMRRAPVPVLAVPPKSPSIASLTTILCPVEENVRGREVLRLAARLAPVNAQFFVVGAIPDDIIDTDEGVRELEQWTPAELRPRSKFIAVSEGHVLAKVADLAVRLRADLIVATEPSTRGVGDFMQGSFAERLMQHSGCPVLTLNRAVTVPTAGDLTLQPVS